VPGDGASSSTAEQTRLSGGVLRQIDFYNAKLNPGPNQSGDVTNWAPLYAGAGEARARRSNATNLWTGGSRRPARTALG